MGIEQERLEIAEHIRQIDERLASGVTTGQLIDAKKFGEYTQANRESIKEMAAQHLADEQPTPCVVNEDWSDEAFANAVFDDSNDGTCDDLPMLTQEHGYDLRTVPYGDKWAGERLSAKLGNTSCYVTQHKCWFVYDGTQWIKDEEEIAERMAIEVASEALVEAKLEDDTKLIGKASRLQFLPRLKAMKEMARSSKIKSILEFDSKPWLLNLSNGVLSLGGDAMFIPHAGNYTHGFHMMQKSPAIYDPNAECPTCDRFLLDVFDGDHSLVQYFWKLLGYSLTGTLRESVLIVCYGTGSNGKSTLFNMMSNLLGDGYATQAHSDTLTKSQFGSNKDYNSHMLKGKRLIITSEIDDGQKLDEKFVKQLTGGDKIVARAPYMLPYEFEPTGKVWLATNHLPKISGVDHGIWRRIKLLPFERSFSDSEQDKQLGHKLKLEMSGILNRAIAGCLTWQRDGLTEPSAVTEATQEYREDMDPLTGFFADCIATGPHDDCTYETSSEALYRTYCNWADTQGFKMPLTQTAFSLQLKARGFRKKRCTQGFRWVGVRTV